MPRPGSGDAIVVALQAAVAALQQAMESLQALVEGFDQDALLARLNTAEAAVQALVARVEAVENATPGVEPPGTVRWRRQTVKLSVTQAGKDVRASWARVVASDPLPSVALRLDDGIAEQAAEGEQKVWSNVPAGTHRLAALVGGVEDARDTFLIQE